MFQTSKQEPLFYLLSLLGSTVDPKEFMGVPQCFYLKFNFDCTDFINGLTYDQEFH